MTERITLAHHLLSFQCECDKLLYDYSNGKIKARYRFDYELDNWVRVNNR